MKTLTLLLAVGIASTIGWFLPDYLPFPWCLFASVASAFWGWLWGVCVL